jgi:ArsR family transcriptional regulator
MDASPHATAFKALADPTRRAILERLKGGDLSAGELAEGFALTGASLSHHLSLLLQAGLVRVRREGAFRIYTLHTTVLQEVLSWLMDLNGKPPKARRSR